jgi:sarcosine oxidase, subunit gamma
MNAAIAAAGVTPDGNRRSVLLVDVSHRMRVGCKGPAAERWLSDQGIGVPAGANRFATDVRGLLAARLATSEFLFESTHDDANAALAPARRALELADLPSGVYPVLRQDFVIELSGPRLHDLFAQTCAVDLVPVERESVAAEAGPLIMTSMIGVSVVLLCQPLIGGSRFTVWSDPSYRHYFWTQLLAIATELGGGPDPELPTRSGDTLP